MATNYELAQLAGAAYKPATTALPLGWSLLKQSNPDPSGYQGYAFARLDAAGNPIEIIIANRGTEILTSQDRTADLQMAANQLPDQYQFAKQFLEQVVNDPSNAGASITTTGHSLGGSLAQLLAAETGLTATTFNPYGTKDLIPALNSRYGLNIDPNATYNNITNHQTMLDGVSRLGSSSPFGSDQLGQMQMHVAFSELPAAVMIASSAFFPGGTSVVAFPATYLAVEFYWSHSIDRFTQEIYPQEALVTQVGQEFKDFVRTLNDQINAVEQAGATAQANLQNDFLQLAGTAGQTYQDVVNATSSAMGQLADLLSAAEKSAVKIFLDFAFDLGNTINGIEQTIATLFNSAQKFIQTFGDPLTLDLNNDGIHTVPLKAPPLLFDINASGIKISTGWIAPDDGLLVLDRNGNGMVDNGSELFGDATPKYVAGTTNPSTGSGRTVDGFAALAQEDTNADGVVNAQDANFASLRVWQDLNQDGLSQSDELTTLDQQGIASFNTARTLNSQMLPSGNQMADLGTYTRTDGSTGATGAPQGMADINLALDTFHRTFTDTIPLTAQAQALPDMQGSGKVRDLREAASLPTAAGATLAGALASYSAAGTREEQLAQIDTLIGAWGATAEFGTLQSRAAAHGYTFTLGLDATRQTRLAALEAFNGRGYFKMPWEGASFGESARQGLTVGWGGNPQAILGQLWGQASLLDQSYNALRESVYQALLPQTRLKPYLDQIGLTLTGGNFNLDFSAVQSAFTDTASTNPDKAVADLVEFNRYGKDIFADTSWQTDGWQLLGDMLNNVAVTPAIQKTLTDFNVGMDGQPGFNPQGTMKDDVLIANSAGSTLDAGYGNDILVGGNGADTLRGNSGSDLLLGDAGNDTLDGGWGADTLQGGAGSDTLAGGYHNDTYLYNRGDGADSIVDSNWGYWGYGDANTLQFGDGIALADIAVNYDSATGKVVLDLGNGDAIDIGYPYLYGIQKGLAVQQLRFADGSVVSTDSLLKQSGMTQNGTAGADVLQGSDSRDYADMLNGGTGDDTLNGADGNDVLNGGAGNDELSGGEGSDTYIYNLGDGADVVVDSAFAYGNWFPSAINTLQFGAGITLDMVTPRFDSTSQAVILDLGNGNSIDIGTVGALSVQTLKFADSSTVAVSALIADQSLTQVGTEGADMLVGSNTWLYRDVLQGLGGDDVLQGLGGNDELDGGAGNDTLDGGVGNDILIGGDGNDTLNGGDASGNDVLQGGTGSDVLAGGNGSDTYIYNLGDGADTVVDSGELYTNRWGMTYDTANNVLNFGAGISADTITPRYDSASGSLLLDLGAGDSVNIGLLGALSIQTLKFADGTEIAVKSFLNQRGLTVDGTAGADVLTGSASDYTDYLSGGAGDDTLNAGIGDDVLAGGAGNDVLNGGGGRDTYVFNLGDGADALQDIAGENNVLALGAGITADMIVPRLDGATGEVRLDFGNGNSILVGNYNAAQSSLSLFVVQVNLADGTTADLGMLLSQQGFLVEGKTLDDSLQGAMSHANRMSGSDGNDALFGGQRDDTLDGGSGSDVLDANYGNDVLTGGIGDDAMYGGEGNDVYVYNLGDGSDVIGDTMERGQINTVRLGAGADVQSVEYRGGATGDFVLYFADGGSLRITGVTADNAAVTCPVQRFELADGSVLSAQQLLGQHTIQVEGTDSYWWDQQAGRDSLNGTNLADNISGYSGYDTLLGGSGDDVLDGGLENDVLSGDAGNDTLLGGEGNDTLYGREGDDVLAGGMGDDVLQGGTGNDTYLFGLGDGVDRIGDSAGTDALRFGPGIAQADLLFSKAGVDLRIALANGMDAVMLENWFAGSSSVNTLLFDDGSTFDLGGIAQSVADQPVIGTSGNDTLLGSIYNDTLQGGQGNDTLIGGTGEDVYRFNAGDGVDQIYELSSMTAVKGGDTLEFGAGITPDMLNLSLQVVSQYASWNTTVFPDPNADLMYGDQQRQFMNIQIGGMGDAIQVMSGKGAIEKFRFADGSEYTWQEMFVLQGGGSVSDSNDSAWTYTYAIWNGTAWVPQTQTFAPHRILDGTGLAATFEGGVGDDTMLGGMQNDSYVFNLGDGHDVIADFGGQDEIAFGSGITAQDLVWQYDPASATPFVLNVGTGGDSLAILDGEKGTIERFSFSDGSVLTFADLLANQGGLTLQPPSDIGGGFSGLNNNNLIVGTDGADTIYDGGDSSFIAGGKGDDVIELSRNANTVLFRQGDGLDTVNVDGYASAATLLFGPDVDPASLKIDLFQGQDRGGAAVHDMRIAYGSLGDSITVLGAMPGNSGYEVPSDAPRIRIEFADGTAWSYADLLARAQNIIVADPNKPLLIGTPGNDTFVIGDQSAEYTVMDAAGIGNANTADLGWSYSGLSDMAIYEEAPFLMAVPENSKFPFTLSLVGGSLSVQFDNGVILNIDGFDPNDPLGSCAIRNFKFSDGTVLGIDQVLAAGIEAIGTDAADTVQGTAVSDRINGQAGDDMIVGGKGNDVLRGGTGNDTYVFDRGGGADTIEDTSFYWGRQQLVIDNNVLRLGTGIDPSAVAVKFDASNGKVYLDIGSGDSVCVGEPGNFSVQTIQFDDGTVWDEWLITDRTTIGAIQNPGAGQGTGITYSATLADGAALPDWLSFDPATGTFSGTPANDDVGTISVTVTETGSSGQPVSSTFALDVLNVNDAPEVVMPLTDQGAMEGQAFSYTLPGGATPDGFLSDATDAGTPEQVWPDYSQYLGGGVGNDTHLFARGDGNVYVYDWDEAAGNVDTVQLVDVLPSDVTVSQNAWGDVTLAINGSADSLTMEAWLYSDAYKIEQLVFADGTVWGANDIQSRLSTVPSSGSDYITGTDGSDSIHALAGDDAILAGAGDDTVLAGAGHDIIDGGSGSNILVGGSGSDDISSDWNYTDTSNDFLDGGAGDDYVYGSISNDLLMGGAGDDEVAGDDGNDVILFNRGDGNDFVYAWSENGVPLAQRADTLSLGEGIAYGDLSFSTSNGYDLTLNLGNGESITFGSWLAWQENHAVSTLQIITEAMPSYDANSADPLLNKCIQQFDFLALANRFEAELAADPTITTWQLAPHLADFSLGGSDTAAIGGDMAYLYGKNGNLDGLTEAEVRAQLNDSPFGIGNQALAKVNPVTVSAVFADADIIHGDSLTYSATLADGSALPAWLAFDASTQTFSGTPGRADAGILNVAVTATDTGGLSATTNFVLTVTGNGPINVAPLAAVDAVNVSEDAAQITIAAADLLANDTDPDAGDALVLSGFDAVSAQGNTVTQDAAGDLVFDIGDRYQSLGAGQTANDSFTCTVSDAAGLTSTAAVEVTITGVNDAPVVAVPIAGQQTNEDAPFSFTVPTGAFTDIDSGDVLTYSATLADGTALPAWLTFDAATQTFSGAPGNQDVGGYSVTVTATDTGGLTASSVFSVDVANINDAPIVSMALADHAALQDAPFSFTVPAGTFDDVDFIHGDALTCSATLADGSALSGWLTFDAATQTFSGTPLNGDVGSLNVLVTATDRGGLSASSAFNLNVANVNDAPTANADAGVATEDGGAVLLDAAALLANDTDPDFIHGDALNIVGVSQAASGAAVSMVNSAVQYDIGTLFQSLGKGQTATDTFGYTVSDTAGAASTAQVTMTVTGVNDGPVTVNDTAAVQEDVSLIATGNVLANDSDVDQGTVLSVADAGLRAGSYGSLTLAADGSYSYALDNASPAVQSLGRAAQVVEHFGYTATDGIAGTASVLDVFLKGTNDAPILIAPLADQYLGNDKHFSWQMPEGSFTDIDQGDTLGYAATLADGSALPDWLSFDAATRTFSGETPKKAGFVDVMVIATDSVAATGSTAGSLSASDVFRISVSRGNEGVGNGEDAPPPGHDRNCNDGGGTSPGRPGRKGGNGYAADSGAHSHGKESDDRSPDSKANKGGAHAKDNEDDASHRTEELIRAWFEEESASEQFSSSGALDRHGAWGGQIDRQVKRNVARGVPGNVSSEWERMNARLKKHLEQSGGDDGLFAESGTGSRSFGLFDSQGYSSAAQLGMGNGQQMKGFAGLKEGLERLGG